MFQLLLVIVVWRHPHDRLDFFLGFLEAPNLLDELHDVQLVIHLDPRFRKQALLPRQLDAVVAAEAVQALTGPRGVLVVEYSLGAEALVAGLLCVHALYQVVVKLVELEEAEDHHQKEVESLVEPSNVADPVQQAIDIPIDSVKV